MDLAEIERVIRVGMCAEKRMAECGCEWCSQRLAAVEAVRALHERAERAKAKVETLRLYLARALRGCDPAERAAIEADLASEDMSARGREEER